MRTHAEANARIQELEARLTEYSMLLARWTTLVGPDDGITDELWKDTVKLAINFPGQPLTEKL